MKKEVTQDATRTGKPTRLIYPVEDIALVQAACFVVPLKRYLLERTRAGTFFGTVGLDPAETGQKVQDFCRLAGEPVGQTDFSKMDGTHGVFDTEQYAWMYKRAFDRKYYKLIDEFTATHQKRQINLPSCKPDVRPQKINSGYMNLSGKMDTTESNVWRNGFVDYVALRRSGMDADKAYAHIGPKLGDDGLCIVRDHANVAASLGFRLTFENVDGGKSVSFLSRIYTDPLNDIGSICDPKRAVARIPVTVNSDPIVGLANKVAGYLVTDADTPIVGAYCRALQRVHRCAFNRDRATADEVRRIDGGAYPIPRDRDAVIETVARSLGIGADDVVLLDAQLEKVKTAKELRKCRIPHENPELPAGATFVAPAAH